MFLHTQKKSKNLLDIKLNSCYIDFKDEQCQITEINSCILLSIANPFLDHPNNWNIKLTLGFGT